MYSSLFQGDGCGCSDSSCDSPKEETTDAPATEAPEEVTPTEESSDE
jgi:hypothetical protein